MPSRARGYHLRPSTNYDKLSGAGVVCLLGVGYFVGIGWNVSFTT